VKTVKDPSGRGAREFKNKLTKILFKNEEDRNDNTINS